MSPGTPLTPLYRRTHNVSFLSPQAVSPSLVARRNELRQLLVQKEQELKQGAACDHFEFGAHSQNSADYSMTDDDSLIEPLSSNERDQDQDHVASTNSGGDDKDDSEDVGLRPHQPSGSGDAPVLQS